VLRVRPAYGILPASSPGIDHTGLLRAAQTPPGTLHRRLVISPMNIPFIAEKLANGLDVIVRGDHGCPIVAMNLWYRRLEERAPGDRLCHLFKHRCSKALNITIAGKLRPLQEAGAALSGSTSAAERTTGKSP
jgi:hypothetical protein